jgi:hypothetical protein
MKGCVHIGMPGIAQTTLTDHTTSRPLPIFAAHSRPTVAAAVGVRPGWHCGARAAGRGAGRGRAAVGKTRSMHLSDFAPARNLSSLHGYDGRGQRAT